MGRGPPRILPPISVGVLHLDVYGLTVEVEGWSPVLEALRLDFAWFERSLTAAPGLRIVVERCAPDYSAMPDVRAAFVTPRNVVYQDGDRTIVDYAGRALAILDRRSRELLVQGEDAALLHEAVYLFTLSQAGEHLDARGLTRLHALGIVGEQGAIVVLLPSGGGKSTLGLRALQEPGVRLLSDDTPLLDRRGRAHPFVLRIGVSTETARTLPREHVRLIQRLEYPDKHVIALDAFRDRIEPSPQPLAHIVVAERRLGTRASLERIPRRAAVGPLFRDGVVGLGVAQMIEWVLQRGPLDAAGKVGSAASRAACCASALARADTWRLEMGRDVERNWEALTALLR